MENLITLAEAARLADRSKACVRRWIAEGWIAVAKQLPGRNGVWLIDGDDFNSKLPHVLDEMQSRRGGQSKKENDAYGNPRS